MSKRDDTKWKKYEIFDAFAGRIRKTCIVKRDGEWVVRGKSCIVSPLEDGTWDIWICDPENPYDGLHPRSVTNRVSRLKKHAVEGSLNVVDGDAWLTMRSIDFIEQDPALCRLLGIRRKKQLTATQKKELVERLAGRRKAKAA